MSDSKPLLPPEPNKPLKAKRGTAKNQAASLRLSLTFSKIKTADELGNLIRAFRKSQGYTLERVSGLSNVSIKFLSELERGKETAELGKILAVLNTLGLDINISPRGYNK